MDLAGVDVTSIPNWLTAGGVVGALGLILNYIIRNKAGDRDGWHSLFKGLSERVAALEAECVALRLEVNECRKREGEWMTRALTAEALLQGTGEIRQAAASAAAEIRLDAQGKNRKDG